MCPMCRQPIKKTGLLEMKEDVDDEYNISGAAKAGELIRLLKQNGEKSLVFSQFVVLEFYCVYRL